MQFSIGPITISKYDHDSVVLQSEDKTTLVFDPFQSQGNFRIDQKADLILISHDHFDHFSPKDISGVLTRKTKFAFPATMLDKVQTFLDVSSEQLIPVVPLEEYNLSVNGKEITCMAVPAYNVTKMSPQGNLYHPKEKNYVGYVVVMDEVSVYFVADSDPIPEMETLVGMIDVLLLPISGVYVMNIEEAVAVTVKLQPKVVFPMHYGSIVGEVALGEQFKQLLSEVAPDITVVL